MAIVLYKELKEAIKRRNVILFCGAGTSKGLGLPSWSEVIMAMAKQLGYDPEEFSTYGDYLELAEYYEIVNGSIGTFRSYLDRAWHDPSIKIGESLIHKTLVELDFPIIYTTNYDRWLENAYDYYGKPYTKIKNVSDILNIEPNRTQIVKFNGDFDDDKSIVLTESSYFERLSFETPLDIKFRSDILGKIIVFVGYSMTDINLRYLFYKLNKLWDNTTCKNSRPNSYIFLPQYNPVQEAIFRKRGIIPCYSEEEDIGQGLLAFLNKLL